MSQLDPIVNQPYLSINGLVVSNDATTPNTILNISAGICRDSNNLIDMNLGNYLNLSGIGTANASTSLNTASNGLNGLDTGVLAASTMYIVYVIADSSNKRPTGTLLSASATAPTMPFGYDSMRIVGYAPTDSSVHFLVNYQTGSSNYRVFAYDAPQATAVTAGAATSYTAVALTNLVPIVDKLPVSISFSFTPGAASRVLNITPGNATGNAVTITGQVTSVVVSGNAQIISRVTSNVPEVDYKVSNSGDAVAINVAGFQYFL